MNKIQIISIGYISKRAVINIVTLMIKVSKYLSIYFDMLV